MPPTITATAERAVFCSAACRARWWRRRQH